MPGLAHLAGLRNLQVLFLSGTNVGDEGLAHLRGWRSSRSLSLAFTRITDAGCEHLAQLSKLESLSIASTPITNAGISLLTGLHKLRALSIVGTKITEGGLSKLKRAIPRCVVKTDAGTADVVDSELKARAELERIGVRIRLDDHGDVLAVSLAKGAIFTDKEVEHLKWMIDLRQLSLNGAQCHRRAVWRISAGSPSSKCSTCATRKSPTRGATRCPNCRCWPGSTCAAPKSPTQDFAASSACRA